MQSCWKTCYSLNLNNGINGNKVETNKSWGFRYLKRCNKNLLFILYRFMMELTVVFCLQRLTQDASMRKLVWPCLKFVMRLNCILTMNLIMMNFKCKKWTPNINSFYIGCSCKKTCSFQWQRQFAIVQLKQHMKWMQNLSSFSLILAIQLIKFLNTGRNALF